MLLLQALQLAREPRQRRERYRPLGAVVRATGASDDAVVRPRDYWSLLPVVRVVRAVLRARPALGAFRHVYGREPVDFFARDALVRSAGQTHTLAF